MQAQAIGFVKLAPRQPCGFLKGKLLGILGIPTPNQAEEKSLISFSDRFSQHLLELLGETPFDFVQV